MVLQQFVEGKKHIEMALLKADESLTKRERELEGEREREDK